MDQVLVTLAILLSLAGFMFYGGLGLVAFVSYFSVVSPREREAFLKAFLISILLALALLISLLSFFTFGPNHPWRTFALYATSSLSLVPILIVLLAPYFQYPNISSKLKS
jgi:hypothetical protein